MDNIDENGCPNEGSDDTSVENSSGNKAGGSSSDFNENHLFKMPEYAHFSSLLSSYNQSNWELVKAHQSEIAGMVATQLMLVTCSTDQQYRIWCMNTWEKTTLEAPLDFVPYCMTASQETIVW